VVLLGTEWSASNKIKLTNTIKKERLDFVRGNEIEQKHRKEKVKRLVTVTLNSQLLFFRTS